MAAKWDRMLSRRSHCPVFAAIGFALALGSCKRERAPHASVIADAAVSSSQLSDAAVRAAQVATASTTVDAGPVAPKLDGHCKALGNKGVVELEPIMESEVAFNAQPDAIYVLGSTHELARVRLYRFSRQGGPLQVISQQKGIGRFKGFTVAAGAGYYSQAGHLFKLGPEKGATATLAEGVDSPVAVVGDQVLSVQCDRKGKLNHLIAIPASGGEPKTIAELPHRAGERCEYSDIAADERNVYVADWEGQQIFDVSRADGSVRTIISKCGFPGPLILEPDKLVYARVYGLYEIPRAGGTPKQLADNTVAIAPYSSIAANSSSYWVFDAFAYHHPTTLRRLARKGGPPVTFMVLQNRDPNAYNYDTDGLSAFVVDDECVYVGQTQFKRPGVRVLVKAVE
jgi:hypothetical protein